VTVVTRAKVSVDVPLFSRFVSVSVCLSVSRSLSIDLSLSLSTSFSRFLSRPATVVACGDVGAWRREGGGEKKKEREGDSQHRGGEDRIGALLKVRAIPLRKQASKTGVLTPQRIAGIGKRRQECR